MSLLLRLLLSAGSVMSLPYFVRGISVNSFSTALLVAFSLGVVNVIIKPILVILSLPLQVLTLGLFTLVINGFLLLLVSRLVPGFHVSDFVSAFLGALVISVASIIIHWLVR